MIPEIPKRVPCENQGKPSTDQALYPNENTPCLICSGNVLTLDGDGHTCPFTKCPANGKFTIFKKIIDMRYLTDAERLFDAEQAKKIEESGSGFFVVDL